MKEYYVVTSLIKNEEEVEVEITLNILGLVKSEQEAREIIKSQAEIAMENYDENDIAYFKDEQEDGTIIISRVDGEEVITLDYQLGEVT